MKILTIEEEAIKETSVLKNISKKVNFPLSPEDKDLIKEMKRMLYDLGGVGLAAPQVGVPRKIALIYIPESASLLREDVGFYPMHAIINPKYQLIKKSAIKQDFEGCYSVESVMGKVSRPHSIKVKYQDENGAVVNKTIEGFYARVLQHEIDHLNGILITDVLTPKCPQGSKEEMLKLRRKELPEEKRKYFDELMKKKGIIISDD